MLHTLNHSPYTCDLRSLLRIALINDDLILLSDGVIAGLKGSLYEPALSSSLLKVYALKNDVIARGLTYHFSTNIEIINYTDFVLLTEKQPYQIAW